MRFSAEMRNHYSVNHLSTSLTVHGGGEDERDGGTSSVLNTQKDDCKWPPEKKPTGND